MQTRCYILCSQLAAIILSILPATTLADLPHFQDDYALHAPHLAPQVRESSLAAKPQFKLELNSQWGNSFYDWEEGRVDSESVLFSPRAEYSNDNLSLGLQPRFIWSGAGQLDSVIENWHHFFGLPNGRRQSAEQDNYEVFGSTNSDEFSIDQHSMKLAGTLIDLETKINKGFSVRARADLPGNWGHDALDSELSLLYTHIFEGYKFSTGISGIYLCDRKIDGLEFKKLSANGFTGLEFAVTDDWTIASDLLLVQEAIENVNSLPRAYLYLDLGVGYKVFEDTDLMFSIRENPYGARITSDVVGMLTLNRRLSIT